MKLLNLEAELSNRSKLYFKELTTWDERNLNSSSGVFTCSDRLLAFGVVIFDFISKHNPKLYVQLRLLMIQADPSTLTLGGFNKKLKELNSNTDMPADDAKKLMVLLAAELTNKSTLRVLELSECYELFLVGVVSYLREMKFHFGSEDLPSNEIPLGELYG